MRPARKSKQPDLFDPLPLPSILARNEDPGTSHLAAARVGTSDIRRFRAGSNSAKLLEEFSKGEKTDFMATKAIISHASPVIFEGCRKRCSDLRRAGMIADTGKRVHNPGLPDLCIVSQITPRESALSKASGSPAGAVNPNQLNAMSMQQILDSIAKNINHLNRVAGVHDQELNRLAQEVVRMKEKLAGLEESNDRRQRHIVRGDLSV